MNKLKTTFKLSLLVLAVFSLSVSFLISGTYAATTTEVNFDIAPLAVGTQYGETANGTVNNIVPKLITELPPNGDWSVTNTNSTIYQQYKSIGYRLKLDLSTQSIPACEGSTEPYIVGTKRVLETKSAQPNVSGGSNSVAPNIMLYSGPDMTIDDYNSSYDSTNTAPSGTIAGTSSLTWYFQKPITVATFNNDANIFYGIVEHMTAANSTFSTVTAPPLFKAILSCSNQEVIGSETGGIGGIPDDTESIEDAKEAANSPKTGSAEVAGFVSGVILVVLIY